MITDTIHILLEQEPDDVFDYIDHTYTKFPLHPILDSKPLLFLRLFILDGAGTAWDVVFKKGSKNGKLIIGQSMGPFTFTEVNKPSMYFFTLKSKLFTCETGYEIKKHDQGSILFLNLITHSNSTIQKLSWFFIKPVHRLFSKQVLKNIKKQLNKRNL